MNERAGEIFDLGYQSYDGERTGRGARRTAIWRDGVRVSLGLGRGAGAKVAPWLLIAFALVPMVVLVVISAFLSPAQEVADDFELPSFAEYYEWAVVPIGLFAAVVAPLVLCPDRRDGVLTLYATRPITPIDYLASRWLAFFTVACGATVLPEVVLFTWNGLDAQSTGTWLSDNWDVLPRVVLAGGMVAATFTTLSLLMATFTARRAYAAVASLAVVLVGSAVGGIAEDDFSGRAADVASLVGLPQVVVGAVRWALADEQAGQPFDGIVYAGWLIVLTTGLGLALIRRTRGLMLG